MTERGGADDRSADGRLADRIRAGQAEALGELYDAHGTVGETSGVVLADLEPLGSAVTFAITVESSRVEAPTSEPVMVATLGT